MKSTKSYMVLKGLARGMIGALVGSCLFTLIEAISFAIYNGIGELDDSFLLVLLIILATSFVVSLPFTTMGSLWLIFSLYELSQKKNLSSQDAIYKGAQLGFQIGIVLCIIIVGLYFSRGNWYLILFQSITGMILCTVIAGWVSLQLMKDIAKLK